LGISLLSSETSCGGIIEQVFHLEGKPQINISEVNVYADLAQQHHTQQRIFEALQVSCSSEQSAASKQAAIMPL
jgi:hypothetical protein